MVDLAAVDEVTHIEPVRFAAGSDLLYTLFVLLTDGSPRSRPWRWLLNVITQPITFLRALWPFGVARRSIFLLVMQTLDNSIRLFHKRRWWWPFSRTINTEREGGQPSGAGGRFR